jgi:hypothetical protein
MIVLELFWILRVKLTVCDGLYVVDEASLFTTYKKLIRYLILLYLKFSHILFFILYQSTPQDIEFIAPAQSIKWMQIIDKINIKSSISSTLQ